MLRAAAGFLTSLLLLLGGCNNRGHSAREAVQSEITRDVPGWVRAEKLPQAAMAGATLFATSGCTACHTYLGTGSSSLGAPDLTAEAARGRGIAWQIRHLSCPSCVVQGSPMPRFASLGDARIRRLAIFLEASKGKQ